MHLLYVVHRFYPFPGGSEAFVYWMAKESLKRGHQVTVLTDAHQGDVDGIHVTEDHRVLKFPFDLIIVHGADCTTQDFVHSRKWNSPVLYQIIQPSSSPRALNGAINAKYLGCSTSADWRWASDHGWMNKAVRIPHGVPATHLGKPGFKKAHGIAGRVFMSAGGFWKHKGMLGLAEAFFKSGVDATLCLFGYAHPNEAPQESERIRVFKGMDNQSILDALSESDLYVMNSTIEGFGLVLLESMLNGVEWVSRPVGGATEVECSCGQVYESEEQLVEILRRFERSESKSFEGRKWVVANRQIIHTVDFIEKVLEIEYGKQS